MNESKYVLGVVEKRSDLSVTIKVVEWEDGDSKIVKATKYMSENFPLSQIFSVDDLTKDAQVELEVPLWLMKKRGLIVEREGVE